MSRRRFVSRATPLLLHWCVAPAIATADQLGEDGHPLLGRFLPPVPLPRRMWAASRVTFLEPIAAGARVSRCSKVAEISEKQGRSGRLILVGIDHEYAADGAVAIKERQTIVYRDATGTPAPNGQAKPNLTGPGGGYHRFDPVTLFRYSALTFNSHRIHYDAEYARRVESYPGLVVHGPLQATVLAEEGRRQMPDRTPSSFSFRAVSPLFCNQDCWIGREVMQDRCRLWIETDAGARTMEAELAWR